MLVYVPYMQKERPIFKVPSRKCQVQLLLHAVGASNRDSRLCEQVGRSLSLGYDAFLLCLLYVWHCTWQSPVPSTAEGCITRADSHVICRFCHKTKASVWLFSEDSHPSHLYTALLRSVACWLLLKLQRC